MTLTTAALIIAGLSLYSYLLIRRSAHIQVFSIIPFLHRIHLPNVAKVLTDEEHDNIHEKIDVINFRILSCFILAIIAVGLGIFFVALVQYEGNPSIVGFLMSIMFAYLVANYDLNSKTVSWIEETENDLLARIIVKNADAGGFDSLAEYFDAENDKMMAEYYKEMTEITDELEEMLIEEGFDPEKNYNETDETWEEYVGILERASDRINENHSEPPE